MQGTQQKLTEPSRLSPREGSSSCQEIRAARGRGRVSVLMLAKNCQAYPLRCLSCHEFIAPLVQHPWSCSALQRAWRAWQRTLCAHLKNVLKSKQSEHYICTNTPQTFTQYILYCVAKIVVSSDLRSTINGWVDEHLQWVRRTRGSCRSGWPLG